MEEAEDVVALRVTLRRARADEWLLVLASEGFQAGVRGSPEDFVLEVPAAERERTLAALPALAPRHWATFHHVGVLDERAQFDERLARFAGVIADRERRLLAYLRESPRSLGDVARHRFVYRPEDRIPYAEAVERRSMNQHVERLVAAGAVREVEPGRFLAR